MEEPRKLNAVIVRPQKTATIEEIDNDLKTLQSIVGGNIEQICPWEDDIVILCNEDGKVNGLMYNRGLYDEGGNILELIAGTFVVVGLGEENYRSLTEEEAEKYYQEFRKPEFWLHN